MEKPVRALLLAAGLGTRLRPLTLTKPKCLVEINGKPILEHWLDKLEAVNVESVIINTHYLHKKVEEFLKTQKDRGIKIKIINEKNLLGTAGTFIASRDFFKESTGLLIHADNYTNFNLKKLFKSHEKRPKECVLTMLTFDSTDPKNCGIVEVNSKGVMRGFYEKNATPPGNKANGAIYIFDYNFVRLVEKKWPNAKDFSTEIIPNLIGEVYTFHTKDPFIDIGTPASLKKAQSMGQVS